MSAQQTRRRALALGLVVAAVFLWLFARGRDWAAIWEHVKGADPVWLGLALALQVVLYLAKAYRWGLLIPPEVPGFGVRWDASVLGFGANCVLPGRVGEALRVATVHKLGPLPVSHGVSSLVLERILDLAAIGFLLGAGGLTLGGESSELATLRLVGGGVAAVTLAAPMVLYLILGRNPEAVEPWIGHLVRLVPERFAEATTGFLTGLARGFAVVDSFGKLAWVFLVSVAHWTFSVVSLWLTARALGLGLSMAGAAVVLGAVAFAVALPQAPGFLGPYQWAAAETLRVLGQPTDASAAYAIVAWLVGLVPPIVLAAVSMLRLGRGAREEILADEAEVEEALD